MTLPRRLGTLLTICLLTLPLAACGSDDEPSADSGSSSDGSGTLDDVPADALLDAFGQASSSTVGSIEGYEIDGTRVVFDSTSVSQSDGASTCTILAAAASSLDLPDDTEVVVEFSDGPTTCDLDG